MKQVWFFHGGDSFSSQEAYLSDLESRQIDYDRLRPYKGWQEWMIGQLSGYDVLTPRFPNKDNAKYAEWVIYFEKLIPLFSDDTRLVGHSLGAMFLAKYLHENPLSKPVHQLVLLAGGYDEAAVDYGSFKITSAKGVDSSVRDIHIMHSRDDFVVPYEALDKYAADLPTAKIHRFDDKNHFLDATFPELVKILQQI